MSAPPNGCRHCGIDRRAHCQQWNAEAGWHQWAAPTDAQRLERMRARRAERLAPPELLDPATVVTITANAEALYRQLDECQQCLNTLTTT